MEFLLYWHFAYLVEIVKELIELLYGILLIWFFMSAYILTQLHDTTTELDAQVTPDTKPHTPIQLDQTSPAADEKEAGGRGRSMNRPLKSDRPKRVQSWPLKYKDFVSY